MQAGKVGCSNQSKAGEKAACELAIYIYNALVSLHTSIAFGY